MNNVLSNVENQVNSLLCGNSTDEGEQWDRIIQILEIEVFLLKQPFGGQVIWSSGIKSSNSLWDWDSIRESKWMCLLSE